MATPKRIADLKAYCEQWEECLNGVITRMDELRRWQDEGMHIFEKDDTQDLLPTMIEEADYAARNLKTILIRMQDLHNRAIAGEDV